MQYNVQFYNQGLYTTCDGLINASGGAFPGTALLEIPKSGIPLDMLVIGKPATAADATNGFMDPATLGTCVKQAKAKGWNGGVMVWQVRLPSLSSERMGGLWGGRVDSNRLSLQYPHADAAWIKSAKGGAF